MITFAGTRVFTVTSLPSTTRVQHRRIFGDARGRLLRKLREEMFVVCPVVPM
jgi:hypothetical protein